MKERTRVQPLICDGCGRRFELEAVWRGEATISPEVVAAMRYMLLVAAVACGWGVRGPRGEQHQCPTCVAFEGVVGETEAAVG